jgi:hypothetical protein
LAEAGDHLGQLIAGGRGCGRQVWAGKAVLGPAVALPAQQRMGVGLANATIPAGAIDAGWRKGGAVEPPMPQEVSSQNEERAGVASGRMLRMTMAPPQRGQRSVSCSCSTGGSGDGASSSRRQDASLAAQWRLARKP